jgi:hypothetical protein
MSANYRSPSMDSSRLPRAWFTKLATTLIGLGFIESKVDYSLFILHKSNVHFFMLIYVDDIIVTGNSAAAITTTDYLS